MASDNADREKLHKICELSFKAQAIWWLNAFFDSHSGEAEKLWAYVIKAAALDIDNHENGSGLDEVNAHRLLEIFDETLTVREMRTQLRSVGAITEQERPKNVPLAHLLLARYKSDWRYFVNAPQGASEEIEKAQRMLEECKAAFQASEQRAQEAAAALQAAKAAAAAAAERQAQSEAAAAQAAAAEQELRNAQAALDAALEAVKREEDAYNAKTADLQQKSETGGVVSMNRAKNELAQHLAEDPLPLRKAKITAEAAAKRNERAIVAAGEAKLQAEAAARQAAEATAAAHRAADASAAAKAAADAAVDEALRSLQAAEAFLKEVQATAGGGRGALWWIERELHEQRKYLPTSRGGIAK